jgi:hypothetical protein
MSMNEKEQQTPQQAPSQHLMVSDELLTVIGWLVAYEQESLKKILAEALPYGLQEALAQAPEKHTQLNPQEIQTTIFELFALLEDLTHEVHHEAETTTFMQRSLVPAINRIDMHHCDEETVTLSAAKATAAAGTTKGVNTKEILCRELLRRWKPDKKTTTH